MILLTNTQFVILLNNAVVAKLSDAEYQVYNNAEDEFYFDVDIDSQTISQQGDIKLTGEQYESICEKATARYEEDQKEKGDFTSSLMNYHDEYGVDDAMFI